jgi:hypothetical protein
MTKSGTPAQVKKKFAEWGDYDWYGKCAAVVMTVCRHFGDVGADTFAYGSARAAFNAATIESKDWKKAPRGAVHYWDYYGKNSKGDLGNWGHVGVDMTGGGVRVLNASHHYDVKYGNGVGEGAVPDITGRVGQYLGWSRKYGKAFYANIDPEPAAAGAMSYPNKRRVLLPTNLRKSPKTGSVVTVIPAGTVVQSGRAVNGWTPVKYGKKTGWVASDLVSIRTRTVTLDGLWLRDKPSGKRKATLKKGTRVTVLEGRIGHNGKVRYVKVRVGARVGWVIRGRLG